MGIKLGSICKFQSGGTPSKGKPEFFNGTIPWITTTALNNGNIGAESAAEWISEQAIKESTTKIVPAFSIMVGTRVGVGKVAINIVDMSTSQDVVSLLDIDARVWNKAFLCKFLQAQSSFLNAQARGATIKGIKITVLSGLEIPEISLEEQMHISQVIDEAKAIITLHRQQLQKLDELVKARFVEMFGDPVSNPHNFEKVALSDLADIKIGPFGSLLHKEDYIEGGRALVNPSHIVDGKIVTDERLTVSNEKYTELSAYHLQIGDVVLGRRGEMGRCAVVSESGLLCGTGSLLIRPKGEVTADYIQKIISFPSFKKTIEDMAVGQTMPNLNVPIVSGFQIIKPPIEIQETYYAFAEQTDKSKAAVQKALDEAQLLFDSLMQKYFG